MDFKNLDALPSFQEFTALKPSKLKDNLSQSRIENSHINVGGGVSYNYAALPVDKTHIEVFKKIAKEQQLIAKYMALLSGERMNTGENRLVLHQLTRGETISKVEADGEDKGAFYASQLAKIKKISTQIREGKMVGSTGKPFKTVVQIGIGGSDLGPRAIYLALKGYCVGKNRPMLDAQFISNVDPDDAANVIKGMDFETTLFILVSKSGTTQETLTNRDLILAALQSTNIPGFDASQHMIAVTSKTSPLAQTKALRDAIFFDDYIGGRYSVSSAVGGTIISIALGFDIFEEFLAGAHEEDLNALSADITKNAAMMDAMIGVYMRNVLGYPATAVLPYSQAMSRFPAHLQQLDMESNGKHVNRDGQPIHYQTGPLVFGEPGTNGQHSFYQWLHQGTDIVPLQFIGFIQNQRGEDITVDGSTSQVKLNANLTAQIVAFALGKTDENPNKEFEGERCSSLLYAKQLTPEAMGAILAHYENKVMFQGFIWNINSFDQEGVQLGKKLAKKVLSGCEGDENLLSYHALLSE